MSIQEVCVQMGVSQLSETAANIMSSYESHLKQTLGDKFADLNLSRSLYPCAAVMTACKLRHEKIDQAKIVDLSRSCLLYTSPSPRDVEESRMPSSA